jgi:hypothetical protein
MAYSLTPLPSMAPNPLPLTPYHPPLTIPRPSQLHKGRGSHEPSDCETEGSACTANNGCILRYQEELISILAEGRAVVTAAKRWQAKSGAGRAVRGF